MHKAKLTVGRAYDDEVFKDIVRIPSEDRGPLEPGFVHLISTNIGSAYFVLRGTTKGNAGKILMDDAARKRLGLKAGHEYEFTIRKTGFWGELKWAWSASDPAYKVPARLGVLSFYLAILATVLALWPLVGQCLLSAIRNVFTNMISN